MKLIVPGRPVPLQRSRTRNGHHYLPARSKAYQELVQTYWMAAGRPSLGDAPFCMSAQFYGARANSDIDNCLKQILDSLGGLAFDDDKQCICLLECRKLPVDENGPRTEVEIWKASNAVGDRS